MRADAEQLLQVFLNLSLNALQAMPDGGKLSISTALRRSTRRGRRGRVPRGPLPRHRRRHPARRPEEPVHPVLHDQGEGHRPRACRSASASSRTTAARSRCARSRARARRSPCSCRSRPTSTPPTWRLADAARGAAPRRRRCPAGRLPADAAAAAARPPSPPEARRRQRPGRRDRPTPLTIDRTVRFPIP